MIDWGIMNALIKVLRNETEGVAGIFNGFTETVIMEKWEVIKKDYAKFDKGKGVTLILEIDNKPVDKHIVT